MTNKKSYYVIAMESEEYDNALIFYNCSFKAFIEDVESASLYREKELADRELDKIKDEWDCELKIYNVVIKTIKEINIFDI